MNRSTAGAALIGFVLAGALAGCSSLDDQVQSTLTETTSAVRTAEVGLALRTDDRATRAVTSTALVDALDELTSAASTLTHLQTSGSGEAKSRAQVLDLVRRSTDAVNRARSALAAGEPLQSVTSDLSDLGNEAHALLARYQRNQK